MRGAVNLPAGMKVPMKLTHLFPLNGARVTIDFLERFFQSVGVRAGGEPREECARPKLYIRNVGNNHLHSPSPFISRFRPLLPHSTVYDETPVHRKREKISASASNAYSTLESRSRGCSHFEWKFSMNFHNAKPDNRRRNDSRLKVHLP